MRDAPTEKQVEYIKSLLTQLGYPLSHVAIWDTCEKASVAIDAMQARVDKKTPIKDATRAAVFIALKATSITKQDMYDAVGITTLSRGATELAAKRCLRWLEGILVKKDRTRPASPEAELLGEVAEYISANADPKERPTPDVPVVVAPAWHAMRDARLAAGPRWSVKAALEEARTRFPDRWLRYTFLRESDILSWIGYDSKTRTWTEVPEETDAEAIALDAAAISAQVPAIRAMLAAWAPR